MFMLYYFTREGSQFRLIKQKYDVTLPINVVVWIEFLSRPDIWLQSRTHEHTSKRKVFDMPH